MGRNVNMMSIELAPLMSKSVKIDDIPTLNLETQFVTSMAEKVLIF